MPVISLDSDVQIWCGKCNTGLCGNSTASQDRNGYWHITVDPCEDCLIKSRDDGYNDGYNDGCIEEREG